MAMRYTRVTIWLGAVGALVVMTVLSTLLGHMAPLLIPKAYTHYAAALLFLVFGVRMLRDAKDAGSGASEELEEVELELTKKQDVENGDDKLAAAGDSCPKDLSPRAVLLQAFTLTFLAEWGDRSQIATIALAADEEPFGVTLGAIVGHSICTGMAVVGGKLLASRISERMVLGIGGVLFVLFAVVAVVQGPD
jgi:putative Ca2+/H+ antiporter (TMEM165/GDT1 family)